MNICVLSGTTKPIFKSAVNHEIYAAKHAYGYRFDGGPYDGLRGFSYLKWRAVEKVLGLYDWVFWLDDDAFFTNFDVELEGFLQDLEPEIFFVACKGPITPTGKTVFLSAGQFLIRSCPEAVDFMHALHSIPLAHVKSWWNPNRLGGFTNGDQDALVYYLHAFSLFDKVRLLSYEAFNCRTYHYQRTADEHFLVHFPGFRNKLLAVREFGKKFGLDEDTLVPPGLQQTRR